MKWIGLCCDSPGAGDFELPRGKEQDRKSTPTAAVAHPDFLGEEGVPGPPSDLATSDLTSELGSEFLEFLRSGLTEPTEQWELNFLSLENGGGAGWLQLGVPRTVGRPRGVLSHRRGPQPPYRPVILGVHLTRGGGRASGTPLPKCLLRGGCPSGMRGTGI